MNLYEIQNDYRELTNLLLESEGELTPELEAGLAINKAEFLQKAVAYGKVIKEIQSEADAIESLVKSLQAKLKAKQRHVDTLKERIQNAMEDFGEKKIGDTFGSISLVGTKSVNIWDDANVPEEYTETITTVKIDKAALKKAIEAGQVAPEVAEMKTSFHLRISF